MLEFKNLNIKFDKPILKNISESILKNTITFIIGPNGSGKTSLLKILGKVQQPFSGEISTQECPVYLGSQWVLQNGLTGEDIFDLYDVYTSPWFDAAILDFFEVKNLLSRKLETLSSGERQRILICAVLFHRSNIVLLDEPTSFLDWNFSLRLQSVMEQMQNLGRAFVVANHDLHWILRFTNTQTWVLFQEKIALKGSTAHVLGDIKLNEVFKIKTKMLQAEGKNFLSISL